jgi:hypothetical protein
MCFSLKQMFGVEELASEAESIRNEIRKTLRPASTETHTFTIQKPFCCGPAALVRDALEPYGVKIISLSPDRTTTVSVKNFAQLMRIEFKRFDNLRYGPGMFLMALPLAMQCTVTVRKAQAEWAEYLIERTKRMCVVGGNINSKNRDWANRHDGKMPKPWIEKSCSSGNDLWQQVDVIMKEKGNNVQRTQE